MRTFELVAINDSRKSFYRKAYVMEEGNRLELLSYGTIVAIIEDGKIIRSDIGKWSLTTDRHIREFIYQFAKEV